MHHARWQVDGPSRADVVVNAVDLGGRSVTEPVSKQQIFQRFVIAVIKAAQEEDFAIDRLAEPSELRTNCASDCAPNARLSTKGNPTLKADGFRVTVYPRGQGFAATIAAQDGDGLYHARRNYPTVNEAKLAAFDHITRLLARPTE